MITPNATVTVGSVSFAHDRPLALIAGPCQLESRAHALETAAALMEIAGRAGRKGVSALIVPLAVNEQIIRQEIPIMIGASLLLVVVALFCNSLGSRDAPPEPVPWLPYAAILATLTAMASLGFEGLLLHGSYRVDGLSQFFKLAVAAGLFLASVIVGRQPQLEARLGADFQMLLAVSAWGLMLLASCVELVTMVVALEVSSFCLFGLVPLRARSPEAAEAGVKYVLFGAAATGVSLYGLGLLWAGAGTTYLAQLGPALAASPMAAVGLAVFLAGFFYIWKKGVLDWSPGGPSSPKPQ